MEFEAYWIFKKIMLPYIVVASIVLGWLYTLAGEWGHGVQAARDCIGFMSDPDGFDNDRQAELVKDGDYTAIQGWIDDCADIRNIGTYRRIYSGPGQ